MSAATNPCGILGRACVGLIPLSLRAGSCALAIYLCLLLRLYCAESSLLFFAALFLCQGFSQVGPSC